MYVIYIYMYICKFYDHSTLKVDPSTGKDEVIYGLVADGNLTKTSKSGYKSWASYAVRQILTVWMG